MVRIAGNPGDIVARSGTMPNPTGIGGKSIRFPLLSMIAGEEFNHTGIVKSFDEIHHIEANGYESVKLNDFFSKENAISGAVIRFKGYMSEKISKRVADIIECKRYKKIPGNPFSTYHDSRTVSCNEFVYSIFKQAVSEIALEFATNPYSPKYFAGDFARHYINRNLANPNITVIEGPALWPELVAWAMPLGASFSTSHPMVKFQFEGKIWCSEVSFLSQCLRSRGILENYTPESFIKSSFFEVVQRFEVN